MSPIVLSLLQSCALFNGLSAESLRALAACCGHKTFAKGDTLFTEGAPAENVYLLHTGSVQLVKSSEAGFDVVVRTLTPGEVFAEAVLFERETYPVTATAIQRSAAVTIPRTRFMKLLDDAGFRRDFLAALMRRMRYLTERMLYLAAYDVRERFWRFIEERHGRKASYTLNLSRKALAAAIGTTPETLSRLLRRLDSDGVRVKGKTLSVPPGFWEQRSAG